MYVGESFADDKNRDLKWIQHDLWFKINGAWLDNNGFAMSSSMYIFWCARSSFLFHTGENPLFFPEREKLASIESFDHRVLQYAHHKIAAFYRWIQAAILKPAFVDGVAYNDWASRKLKAEIQGTPFTEGHRYHTYMLDAWKIYLRHEIESLTWGNIPLSESIIKTVLFQNTEQGYAAEEFIDEALTLRYGIEFDYALKNHNQISNNQSDERQGYIYIMISPALRSDFIKIGKTTRTPERRADELSIGTGVPLRFYVAFDILVSDCHLVEKLVHERLKLFRSSSNREFFEIPLKEAIKVIQELSKNHPPKSALQSDAFAKNMAERR